MLFCADVIIIKGRAECCSSSFDRETCLLIRQVSDECETVKYHYGWLCIINYPPDIAYSYTSSAYLMLPELIWIKL